MIIKFTNDFGKWTYLLDPDNDTLRLVEQGAHFKGFGRRDDRMATVSQKFWDKYVSADYWDWLPER